MIACHLPLMGFARSAHVLCPYHICVGPPTVTSRFHRFHRTDIILSVSGHSRIPGRSCRRLGPSVARNQATNRQGFLQQEVDMELTNELVYIVDDEPNVGDALSTLLRANGKQVRTFTSGQDFLDFPRHDNCACLILDLKMPGLGGLDVQQLISTRTSIPVIFLTGRGDIPSTVKALKGGAVDFLTKPVDEQTLLASVGRALLQDRANRQEAHEHAQLLTRYETLTPREREVLPLLVSGLLNKQAAFELGITEYTVQIHRGHIMRKMEADSFATLVKLAGRLNLAQARISCNNA
jgi:FixJ family two-component response regulator